jgi:transposase-like protein
VVGVAALFSDTRHPCAAFEHARRARCNRFAGPGPQHTLEEKRRIVEETHVKGASVSTVARRHNVNPNQVFAWRQLYRQGLLDPKPAHEGPPIPPVKVSTPTVL